MMQRTRNRCRARKTTQTSQTANTGSWLQEGGSEPDGTWLPGTRLDKKSGLVDDARPGKQAL